MLLHLINDLGFSGLPRAGVVGSCAGRQLIICGSGRCLWDDVKAARAAWPDADVMAIKQAGIYLPFKYQHWAGAHGERFQWMIPLRREGYYFHGFDAEQRRGVKPQKLGVMTHSEKSWPLVDCVWPSKMTGTSALFGTRVGLGLGYDEILLCGVPLDRTGRFYDAPWDAGVDLNVVDMREWEAFLPVMQGRVKSMSGRTRELLGGI